MEFEKIRDIIAATLKLEPQDITKETAFLDLNADSLDLFQIITELEEAFGVEISSEHVEEVRTVGDVMEQIQQC